MKSFKAAAALLMLCLLLSGCFARLPESASEDVSPQTSGDAPIPEQILFSEPLCLPTQVEISYPDGAQELICYACQADGTVRRVGEDGRVSELRRTEDGTPWEEVLFDANGEIAATYTYAYDDGVLTGVMREDFTGRGESCRFTVTHNDFFNRGGGVAAGEMGAERELCGYQFERDEAGRLLSVSADYRGEERSYDYRENGWTLTLRLYGKTVAVVTVEYRVEDGRIVEKTVDTVLTDAETAPAGFTAGKTVYRFRYGDGEKNALGRYCLELSFLRYEDYLRHFIDEYY